ncbi:HAMP domain-containing sensor histidine kinase [Ferrovibrio sp.]|uniref:sensor histidine kinase n=1 Tax=Ferrovibrio sp. TaxID=1917215 RepID=UPI0025C7054E|nr:HAMP domain-containing sensor histidine kinase [Ferrovibrio sp.]MBX3453889.1 HAMP domain-containing histidine kinase [Ferrovibrio sp.]
MSNLVDTRTLVVVLGCMLLLQVMGWLLIWRMLPRLPGIRLAVSGSLLLLPAMALVSTRGEWSGWYSVVLSNYLGIGGLALSSLALSAMLGQKTRPWLPQAGFLAALPVWPLYMLLPLDQGGMLSLLAGLFSGYFAFVMARDCLRAKNVQRAVVWQLGGLNIFHCLVQALRGCDGLAMLLRGTPLVPAPLQGLWFLELILYAIFFFIGVIGLIGARIGIELTEQYETLQEEAALRGRLQNELTVALAQESTARREQRDFLDMVGHEFRTPLAIVDRAAELMVMKLPPEMRPATAPPRRTLRIMRSAVRRLRLLIDGFLTEERLLRGDSVPRQEVLAPLDFLRQILRELPPEDLEMMAALPFIEPPPRVLGDPELLRPALAYAVDLALSPDSWRGPPARIEIAPEAGGLTLSFDLRDAEAGRFQLSSAARLMQAQKGRFSVRANADGSQKIILWLPRPAH